MNKKNKNKVYFVIVIIVIFLLIYYKEPIPIIEGKNVTSTIPKTPSTSSGGGGGGGGSGNVVTTEEVTDDTGIKFKIFISDGSGNKLGEITTMGKTSFIGSEYISYGIIIIFILFIIFNKKLRRR